MVLGLAALEGDFSCSDPKSHLERLLDVFTFRNMEARKNVNIGQLVAWSLGVLNVNCGTQFIRSANRPTG